MSVKPIPRSSFAVVRHLTATAFVGHNDCVALHWHRKVHAWLPPGGHIDANEDPVQAVLREIEEETGLRAEVVQAGPRLNLDYPTQVPPPFTIMVEDIHDPDEGYHQHIDMIYMCRAVEPVGPLNDGWLWVGKKLLAAAVPLDRGDGHLEPPPQDVRVIAKHAFEIAAGAPL